MQLTNELLQGYDNNTLVHYTDELPASLDVVEYDRLNTRDSVGVLKAGFYRDGKLMQAYARSDSHVCVIAATGMGKTTGYVIPRITAMAQCKNKCSFVATDPKGEIYELTAKMLEKAGYRVLLLNFRDQLHSECWNPLTSIFRKYRRAMTLYDEVTVEETPDGYRNRFRGKLYDDQSALDAVLDREQQMLLDEVTVDIDDFAHMVITVRSERDPYWEQAAAELLEAFLFAMLEDSDPRCENPITEDTFSFSTIFSVMGTFRDGNDTYYNDFGYFTGRDEESRAYQLAKNTILENGTTTRKCVVAIFSTKLAAYKSAAIRQITSCNSFEIASLAESDAPVALFINYRDELRTSYEVISLFVQNMYTTLIDRANRLPGGKFPVPFRFILDEFGNMPAIKDFETVISACRGRGIYFELVLQSYAQLSNVYGQNVADIIKDNLNVHVFMGSNNPATLKEFSGECGNRTRISPLCALNGKGAHIEQYEKETIPLVPPSVLSSLKAGECVVTEANAGYVMLSMLSRYYMCDEVTALLSPTSVDEYRSHVDPLDAKYRYVYKKKKSRRSSIFD